MEPGGDLGPVLPVLDPAPGHWAQDSCAHAGASFQSPAEVEGTLVLPSGLERPGVWVRVGLDPWLGVCKHRNGVPSGAQWGRGGKRKGKTRQGMGSPGGSRSSRATEHTSEGGFGWTA